MNKLYNTFMLIPYANGTRLPKKEAKERRVHFGGVIVRKHNALPSIEQQW